MEMSDIERGYRAAFDLVADRAMQTSDVALRAVVWNVYHELVREMGRQVDKASEAKLQGK